jgi:protoheme IX farnesyltransferase
MAASGASALNQFIERRRDEMMSRTRQRPLPAGQIARPTWVVAISLLLIFVPSLAVLPFKPALSFFLLLGAFVYVCIYTLWLKPRTLLNIVIGGAAGSAAVMSGGAALDAWRDPAVITLALLVFLWTPSHFWSLAILYKDDYERADVPMLPVHISLRQAGWWVFVHTGATGLAALLLAFSPALGWLYAVPVIIATADLFWRNVKLISDPTPLHARGLFIASNIYLTVVLVALMASSVLHNFWAVL